MEGDMQPNQYKNVYGTLVHRKNALLAQNQTLERATSLRKPEILTFLLRPNILLCEVVQLHWSFWMTFHCRFIHAFPSKKL